MVRGFTKVRNEAPYIGETLDVWAEYCTKGIHVYCDCCTDGTAEVCRSHPAVVEVIEGDLYDPDRARADKINRQMVFTSVERFLRPGDWVAYFDADEHLVEFDTDLLLDKGRWVVTPWWYDVYITPEDVDKPYTQRQWVSADMRMIPVFFRYVQGMGFHHPDQRILTHNRQRAYQITGHLKHYGLGRSVEDWERKARYYREWPQYAEKWTKRLGQAVRHDYTSVLGTPLVKYDDLRRQREHSCLCSVA